MVQAIQRKKKKKKKKKREKEKKETERENINWSSELERVRWATFFCSHCV